MEENIHQNLDAYDRNDLSTEQVRVIGQLKEYIQAGLQSDRHHVAIIEGAAGTGKSVILTKLFKEIRDGKPDPTSPYYGLKTAFTVNHPELLKVYQDMGSKYQNIYKKDYQRPTSIINGLDKKGEELDVLFIDEGHLLLTKSEPYVKFRQQNQLTELIRLAKVVVVVFDFAQVIQSKMYWDQQLLDRVVSDVPHRVFPLDFQYRMQASPAVKEWIDAFAKGDLEKLPSKEKLQGYDLEIFARAADLFKKLKQVDQKIGMARVVSTTGFHHDEDGKHHVVMDDFDLPWDEYDPQELTWAKRPESINEVGSIYTVQGFDLNLVGLLLSPAFEYDSKKDRIWVNPKKVIHREIYKKSPHLTDEKAIAKAKQDFMLNALNILAKRGRYGLYIAAADPALSKRLQELAK
ncbi:DUF2075 domain-containing protein [Fructobacillus papyrifericola]|uniref:DUF2075 domain-containing protein n=1 Tax=Fructobacillus papyrifericola TaxID=2713172 RepID=A0ABS5QU72_9LACO|nr:DUF2075 domain-containing protein [Fructobacillus papyrifericola]MBS9336739.1 DUF2075 domain-containing protein [Fructobacillus papyrifericola]